MASHQQPKASRGTGARRGRPKPSFGRRLRRFLGYISLLVLLSLAGGLVFLGGIFYRVAKDLPSPDRLMNYDPGGVTEVYATDKQNGKPVVLHRLYVENRKFVSISQIPDVLKNATVAIEDERFFNHPGVDLRGIARAVYVNFRGGRLKAQGGSTLTQQLARNVYLSQKKTIARKAQEMMLAIQIEKNFSKLQILEMYLNEVYYGSGAYGVQAASEMYFGRPAKALSLSQAALLAGLPQIPSRISPFENLDAAVARRNLVLTKMAALGYITPQQAKVARSNGVRLIPQKPKEYFDAKAPYFVKYVERQLVERYGYDKVYKGGLKVYTTLNWKMQQHAEQALINGVKAASGQRVTEGALVSLEPRTGYIRAMVGGVGFKHNQYNNVTQGRRQPGSAFKVFVYTAAFDTHRYGPNSRVNDSPVTFPGGSRPYRPKNYGGGYHGWVTVRQALTHSYNIPAVRVANDIGPSTVIQYARRMGITSPLEPNLSLALGSYPVSPLELASAYAVFPRGGNRAEPMSILRVLNHENQVIEENAPQVESAVVGETTTAQMNEILQNVVMHGTAAGAAGIQEIANAHGKTGTTNENKDAWFVGYTPELCTAVWVCGVKRVKQGDRLKSWYPSMSGVTGGRVCAPIWVRFMKPAIAIQRTSGEPVAPLPEKEAPPPTTQTTRAGRPRTAARTRRVEARIETAADTARGAFAAEQADRFGAGEPSVPATPSNPSPEAERAVVAVTPLGGLSLPIAKPVPAPVPPPRRPSAPRPMAVEVSALVCAESGRRATRWCPETVVQNYTSNAPRARCRRHGPRPGDG